MKKLPIFIICLLTVIAINCKNFTSNNVSEKGAVQTLMSEDQKEQIKNILKAFQVLDENKINSGEETYLMLLMSDENFVPNDEEIMWYRDNVSHVDSISQYALTLLDTEKYMELQNLLEKELGNFQSHPNADTYLWYDLDIVLLNLYKINHLDPDTIYEKMASHLELLRMRTDVVQSNWEKPHPLYKPIM